MIFKLLNMGIQGWDIQMGSHGTPGSERIFNDFNFNLKFSLNRLVRCIAEIYFK